jgi:hypothetical protein
MWDQSMLGSYQLLHNFDFLFDLTTAGGLVSRTRRVLSTTRRDPRRPEHLLGGFIFYSLSTYQLGFGIQGVGVRVWGSGFRVQSSGFGVQNIWTGIWG